MPEPKVLIGAPCGKTPVFDEFYDAFAGLECPPGSIKTRSRGGSIPDNLNLLVKAAQEYDCTHLFIVEDDSTFAPDTITRLLAHDKQVVAGFCRSRSFPFRPYIYNGLGEDGLEWYNLKPEDQGLIRCAATGMGGILMDTDIFKVLKKPYFSSYFVGEKSWGQDIVFGKSLIEAGIEVFCDLDVVIDHATRCVISSGKVDGQWQIVFRISEAEVKIPQEY